MDVERLQRCVDSVVDLRQRADFVPLPEVAYTLLPQRPQLVTDPIIAGKAFEQLVFQALLVPAACLFLRLSVFSGSPFHEKAGK